MRVLVAEDDRTSRLVVQRFVEPLGHEVLTAQNGAHAWDIWIETPVDVVISDWTMPDMDGLELCRLVRAGDSARRRYTYFIMLTSMADRAHFLQAIREGADDYLTKPVDKVELQVRLRSARRVVSLYRRLEEQNRELVEVSEERRSFITAVARSLGEGICATDREGRTVFLNPAAEEMLAWREVEVRGRPLADVLGVDLPSLPLLEAAGQTRANDVPIRRKDGSVFPASYVMSVVKSPRGNTGAVMVLRDITERKRIEQERIGVMERERMARLETERALRIREEFLSLASHELKTPLTALRLQVQELQRLMQAAGTVSPERMDRALTVVDRQIVRLTKVTNDLLDVSQHLAGEIDLPPHPIDLTLLVRQAIAEVCRSPLAARAQVSLLTDSTVLGWWDQSRVERAVTNLVENAVKYGGGKPVEVRVATKDGRARVDVRDRGPGIPRERLEQIFERFDRGGITLNSAGFGLGLYVARQMAEIHGGTIHVESVPGVGSVFTLDLPIAPQQ